MTRTGSTPGLCARPLPLAALILAAFAAGGSYAQSKPPAAPHGSVLAQTLPPGPGGAVAPVAPAQPAASTVLDLAQAYQAALEEDAFIRGVRAATDARRERIPQARAQLL